MTTDEFRVNHRAAAESLLAAAALESDPASIEYQLNKALYFETEAMKSVATVRQRALAIGLTHAVDLMRAVVSAEFGIL